MDGIIPPAEEKDVNKRVGASEYYSSDSPNGINQIFIVLQSLCNIAAVT